MNPVSVPPVVRHMLLCEDVGRDPTNPKRIALYGLMSSIRFLDVPPFPLRYALLCVYLVLTGGRGRGRGQIVIVEASVGQTICASRPHPLTFGAMNPLDVLGVCFRIRDCVFPGAGLYWVEFRYDRRTIAREPLLLK
jgi:hypothetical protein